jgi:hypothetical protein
VDLDGPMDEIKRSIRLATEKFGFLYGKESCTNVEVFLRLDM